MEPDTMRAARADEAARAVQERVRALLEYPRSFIAAGMPVAQCPFSGRYSARDPSCASCSCDVECEWLTRYDALLACTHPPHRELVEVLGFAVSFVDARVRFRDHDCVCCRCSACEWLREAEPLLAELAGK